MRQCPHKWRRPRYRAYRRAAVVGAALAALIAALICAPVAVSGPPSDWPRYRADATRSGASAETLTFPLKPVWVYQPDRRPQPAWPGPFNEPHRMPFDYAPVPVIADGLLYVGSTTDDSVRALDATTGELRWRFTTGGPVRFAPDIYEGRAYVASDDGFLYCLDAGTGALIWRFHAARTEEMVLGNGRMISRRPLRSGMLVDSGVVYTTAGMWPAEGVIVFALDAASGEVIWANDTTLQYMQQPHDGAYAISGVAPQGYLALGGDILLVPTGRGLPAAFDRSSGRLLYYRQGEDGQIQHWRTGGAWHTVDAEEDVIANASHGGRGQHHYFRLSTGALLDRGEQARYRQERRYVPENAVRTGEVLIKGGNGHITAAGADWSAEVEGYARRLAVAEGRLYVSTDTGRIYCFAPGETPDGEDATVIRHRSRGALPEPGPLGRRIATHIAERRIDRGYALVLGDLEPDLAVSLATTTGLHVLHILDTEDAAHAVRERLLNATDLYGTRITAMALPDGSDGLPFPPYFANLVIGGPDVPGIPADEIYRVLRPAGGLWLPIGRDGTWPDRLPDGLEIPSEEIKETAEGVVIVRGKLPGAFDWDSKETADERLRWPLALAWFGGPSRTHQGRFPTPIAANGRYFQAGRNHVTAMDAYNGTELWYLHVPWASAGWDRDTWDQNSLQSLSADDEYVYLNFGEVVYRFDAQTGGQQGIYGTLRTPQRYSLHEPRDFTFDVDAQGTSTCALTLTPDDAGLRLDLRTRDTDVSDFDYWELRFDFRPAHRRAEFYQPGELDVFRVVVHARSGRAFPWIAKLTRTGDKLSFVRTRDAQPFTVFDGDPHTALEADDPSNLLQMTFEGGAVEEGTDVRVFLPWAHLPAAGGKRPDEFAFTASLVSSDGRTRRKSHARLTPIRTRLFGDDETSGCINNGWPVFVLDEDAATGEQAPPPLNDLAELPEYATEWGRQPSRRGRWVGDRYKKSYGCTRDVPAAHMDLLRSATLAFYDIESDDGIYNFGGTRPTCGYGSLLGALGVAIQSEGNTACTCAYNFQTSLALIPTDRRPNEDWAIYTDQGIEFGTHLAPTAINLGAPGDRRDEDGLLWIGYPRAMAVRSGKAHTLPIVMDRDERFDALRINTDFTPVANTDRPWIYGTALTGMRRLNLDMFFRHPDKGAVSTAVSRPPRQDGVLADDEIWDGSRSVELQRRDSIQFRHDDEHLYVAYERFADIDRRGTVTPWRISSEEEELEIWDEDRFELRISPQITTPGRFRSEDRRDTLRIAVSVSGKRHAGLWCPDRLEEDDIWSQDLWQSDWSSRIAMSDERFACEVRIPWQDLERIGFDRNKLMVELNQTPLPAEKGRDFPSTWRKFTAAHFRNLRLDDSAPEPRAYTVRLHFAELDATVTPGDRVFDVAVQGETVLRDLDVLAETGGHHRALVREVRGITTERSLDIVFTPHAETLTGANAPILSGLDIEEESPK